MDSTSNTELAATLGNLAIEMHAQPDSAATLNTIVMAAVQLLPGISWAGVAHVRGRKVMSQTPTDDVARTLNEMQDELGEGPVFSVLSEQHTITVADLGTETRWPRFADAAMRLGVHCLMSFRLFVRNEVMGVLTIYGPGPNMFTGESVTIGEILAQHAAVAIAGAAAHEQLQSAVANRDVIGQAKGILMHRDNISSVEAFAVLTRASQETNIKLVDVARFLVGEFERDTLGNARQG